MDLLFMQVRLSKKLDDTWMQVQGSATISVRNKYV